jgi:DNA polymerase III gamma/tau subunit
LDLDDATLSAAVRLGRGSARDALSALDQVVATGSLESARPPFDGLLGALRDRDAVATLSALAELERTGWDVEQLAESLAGELRQIFLMIVAPTWLTCSIPTVIASLSGAENWACLAPCELWKRWVERCAR